MARIAWEGQKWHGGSSPVELNDCVRVRLSDGQDALGRARDFYWGTPAGDKGLVFVTEYQKLATVSAELEVTPSNTSCLNPDELVLVYYTNRSGGVCYVKDVTWGTAYAFTTLVPSENLALKNDTNIAAAAEIPPLWCPDTRGSQAPWIEVDENTATMPASLDRLDEIEILTWYERNEHCFTTNTPFYAGDLHWDRTSSDRIVAYRVLRKAPTLPTGSQVLHAGPDYAILAEVFNRAFDQAARGKGKQRHANGEPFERQVIQDMARRFGVGALLGQAFKKSEESQRLPRDAAIRELLGSMVYLASAVIALEIQANEKGW